MNLSSFFSVLSRVSGMASGRMGVMGRLLVKASFVVLGCFTVMAGCMGMMLRSLLVMLRCFFGHGISLGWLGRPCVKRRDRGVFRYRARVPRWWEFWGRRIFTGIAGGIGRTASDVKRREFSRRNAGSLAIFAALRRGRDQLCLVFT
jgi:hypothetical protein